VICHSDLLFGDIFVVRSLHASYVAARRSPRRWRPPSAIDAFVLAREWLRFRLDVHRWIVALSPRDKASIVERYGIDPEKVVVIPNGVDVDRFRPCPAARARVRASLQIAPDAPVAIFVGHDFGRKGLRHVLGAMRVLAARGLDLELIVAGRDSPEAVRGDLAGSESRVHFVGHRDDIESYYAAADVFALPTEHDVFPLAGVEALAAGLPLLMTDQGGIAEYLSDGENGYFVECDAEDVARKLEQVFGDPERRRQLATRAREAACRFTWPIVAEKLARLIEEVQASRHRG
jgi:UDP-glucose:(heptosyl)LPS alpha-1,3-glucosyltransferase